MATNIVDRGWFGLTPLQSHIVIFGFPRSGTTLLQAMFESCVTDIRTFGRERRADHCVHGVFRNDRMMLSKRPSDIFLADRIRSLYETRQADVRFIAMVRDPRCVLTSVHRGKPGRYYVSVERWRAIYDHWQYVTRADDVVVVRYEDLVERPDEVQQQLQSHCGFDSSRCFSDYLDGIPRSFNTLALNGLRAVDPFNVDRWRLPEHKPRIDDLLGNLMPELPRRVMELGYERDFSWAAAPVVRRRAA